jgi:fibronectin type 3 domain-containing protein
MSGISLPMTIPAGQTASLILAFTPQSPGAATGALTLVSSATNSSAEVPIDGTGVQHSVTLSWDPSTSADVMGYNIYRGTQSGGPYSLINSSPDSNITATDDHVSAGQTYYYVVTTVTSDGMESPYSNQASAVIPSP